MKKIIIVVLVTVAIAAYTFWPKAHVEEPVIMSLQVNEADKTLRIAYIVEKKRETRLTNIQYDTTSIVPTEANDVQVLETQNGYALREESMALTDEQLTYVLSFGGGTLPVNVSFDDDLPIETIAIIVRQNEAVEAVEDGNMLRYTYTAASDETIRVIGHFDSAALISFEQNSTATDFPLTLTAGQSVDVLIHEPYKLSSDDHLLLEIVTTDKTIQKNIALAQPMPKGYLKEAVRNAVQ